MKIFSPAFLFAIATISFSSLFPVQIQRTKPNSKSKSQSSLQQALNDLNALNASSDQYVHSSTPQQTVVFSPVQQQAPVQQFVQTQLQNATQHQAVAQQQVQQQIAVTLTQQEKVQSDAPSQTKAIQDDYYPSQLDTSTHENSDVSNEQNIYFLSKALNSIENKQQIEQKRYLDFEQSIAKGAIPVQEACNLFFGDKKNSDVIAHKIKDSFTESLLFNLDVEAKKKFYTQKQQELAPLGATIDYDSNNVDEWESHRDYRENELGLQKANTVQHVITSHIASKEADFFNTDKSKELIKFYQEDAPELLTDAKSTLQKKIEIEYQTFNQLRQESVNLDWKVNSWLYWLNPLRKSHKSLKEDLESVNSEKDLTSKNLQKDLSEKYIVEELLDENSSLRPKKELAKQSDSDQKLGESKISSSPGSDPSTPPVSPPPSPRSSQINRTQNTINFQNAASLALLIAVLYHKDSIINFFSDVLKSTLSKFSQILGLLQDIYAGRKKIEEFTENDFENLLLVRFELTCLYQELLKQREALLAYEEEYKRIKNSDYSYEHGHFQAIEREILYVKHALAVADEFVQRLADACADSHDFAAYKKMFEEQSAQEQLLVKRSPEEIYNDMCALKPKRFSLQNSFVNLFKSSTPSDVSQKIAAYEKELKDQLCEQFLKSALQERQNNLKKQGVVYTTGAALGLIMYELTQRLKSSNQISAEEIASIMALRNQLPLGPGKTMLAGSISPDLFWRVEESSGGIAKMAASFAASIGINKVVNYFWGDKSFQLDDLKTKTFPPSAHRAQILANSKFYETMNYQGIPPELHDCFNSQQSKRSKKRYNAIHAFPNTLKTAIPYAMGTIGIEELMKWNAPGSEYFRKQCEKEAIDEAYYCRPIIAKRMGCEIGDIINTVYDPVWIVNNSIEFNNRWQQMHPHLLTPPPAKNINAPIEKNEPASAQPQEKPQDDKKKVEASESGDKISDENEAKTQEKKPIKTLEELIKEGRPWKKDKKTEQHILPPSGPEAPVKELEELGGKIIKVYPDGVVMGQLPDGRTIVARPETDKQVPTLEIQGKNPGDVKIKLRKGKPKEKK